MMWVRQTDTILLFPYYPPFIFQVFLLEGFQYSIHSINFLDKWSWTESLEDISLLILNKIYQTEKYCSLKSGYIIKNLELFWIT